MAFIHDDALDALLGAIKDHIETLHICSAEPGTYTEATDTYDLGNKASPTSQAIADRTGGGREFEVDAISDGSVTATGTAANWALVDDTSTKLLAAGALSSSQGVTSGNTFTLTAFTIGVPDPA